MEVSVGSGAWHGDFLRFSFSFCSSGLVLMRKIWVGLGLTGSEVNRGGKSVIAGGASSSF